MKQTKIIDKTSLILGGIFFLFSFIYFYRDTAMLYDSLFAAALAAVLIWGTYMVFRLCLLAFKR